MTKLIIGLGNPGTKYRNTRHNVGFMVLDQLVKHLKLKFKTSKTIPADYVWTDDTELIKPQTFMNRSGYAVSRVINKHGLSPKDILVVSDDLDLEIGKLRQRSSGSSGGHNGIQSIIDRIGTNEFSRLKIGIGRPPIGTDPSDYVLRSFRPDELVLLKPAIEKAVDLLLKEL